MVTGAAAKPDNNLADVTSSADMKFAAATGGFAYAEVTKDSMTVKMVDSSANVLYTYTRERARFFSPGKYVFTNIRLKDYFTDFF